MDELDQAETMYAAGDYQEARRLAASYVAENPFDARGWVRLAFASKKAGELSAALEALERGLAHVSDDLRLLLQYGSWQALAGDHSAALAAFERMESRLDEDAWRDVEGVVRMRRAYSLVHLGRLEEARAEALKSGLNTSGWYCGIELSLDWVLGRCGP